MFGRSKCGQLLEFDKLRRATNVSGQAPRGLRTIPLTSIVGTIGRCCDFDRCFNAIRPHLRRAVSAVRCAFPDGAVPAVDVFKLGEAYFVSDGHKRIAAARAAGTEYVDADVIEVYARERSSGTPSGRSPITRGRGDGGRSSVAS